MKQTSILAQTTQLLREKIESNTWQRTLPSERKLTTELGVGRTTLRKAIEALTTEGYLDPSHPGKARSIPSTLPSRAKTNKDNKRPHLVAWLTLIPEDQIPQLILRTISDLRILLSKDNTILEVYTLPPRCANTPREHLQFWVDSVNADIWLLQSLPPIVRRWFVSNNYKSIGLGKGPEGEPIPSISVDITAAAMHAMQLYLRRGHTHFILIISDTDRGDNALLTAQFDQFIKNSEGLSGEILITNESPSNLTSQLEQTFSSSTPPTAILADTPQSAFGAITWLQQHGFHIPTDVSLILLRSQRSMNLITPKLSHYLAREDQFSRQVYQWVTDLISSGACPQTSVNLIPEFKPGLSVSHPPNL